MVCQEHLLTEINKQFMQGNGMMHIMFKRHEYLVYKEQCKGGDSITEILNVTMLKLKKRVEII